MASYANPQSLNRYSYVLNNPVLYTDPTGHCVNGDIECRDELREMEKNYSVSIKDKAGGFTLKTLQAIRKGMDRLRKSMGKEGFRNVFKGTVFTIGGSHPNGMGSTGHTVFVGEDELNDVGYVSKQTIHELAHVWDNTCNGCMDKGMMLATHSSYRDGKYIAIGQVPTDYSRNAPWEDWAESVTAFLTPGYAQYKNWDQKRQDWVGNALNVVRYDQRYDEIHMP